ncbi:MAG: alpha/beta hydrolase [Leptospirales bacterium]|nr:alpha/beta hydrolase [Leptospirales bacterium]
MVVYGRSGLLLAPLLFALHCSGFSYFDRPQSPGLFVQRDVVYAASAAGELRADLYLPAADGPRPALIALHSGSWRRGSKERMSAVSFALAAHGYVVLNINYRFAPQWPFPAQLEDARAAAAYLRTHATELQVDSQRIGALGYSAGGHIALMLAYSDAGAAARIQAVAAAGAPSNLNELYDLPVLQGLVGAADIASSQRAELYRQASPLRHVSRDDPPTLLIHGRYDRIVPVEQSRQLQQALIREQVFVERRELPQGHMRTTLGYNETEVQLLLAFFDRHLRRAGSAAR